MVSIRRVMQRLSTAAIFSPAIRPGGNEQLCHRPPKRGSSHMQSRVPLVEIVRNFAENPGPALRCTTDHEGIGAAWLAGLGFDGQVCALVRAHVEAKRYLACRKTGYYARLSDAISIPIMVQDAPASGTPLSAAFLARMAKEIAKALTLATTKTRYESLGAEPVGLDNAEFKTLLADETKMLSALIKEAKINID